MEFWLLGYEKKRTIQDLREDVQEWLASILEQKEKNCSDAGLDAMMNRSGQNKQRHGSRRFKISSNCQSYESKNLLDRKFVKQLEKSLRKDVEDETKNRIHFRQEEELQRVKHLILSGKMGVENTPVELLQHPVFRISLQAKRTLDQKRRAAEEVTRRSFRLINSKMLRKLERQSKRRLAKDALDLDSHETRRARRLEKIKAELDCGHIFTREDFDRIWYESPQVKLFKAIETVDEMYIEAHEIVGVFERIQCLAELCNDD